MESLATIVIAILGFLGLGMFWKSRSSSKVTAKDKQLILNQENLKHLKKQGNEFKRVTQKTGKEFDDALDAYNAKYRPNNPIKPR